MTAAPSTDLRLEDDSTPGDTIYPDYNRTGTNYDATWVYEGSIDLLITLSSSGDLVWQYDGNTIGSEGLQCQISPQTATVSVDSSVFDTLKKVAVTIGSSERNPVDFINSSQSQSWQLAGNFSPAGAYTMTARDVSTSSGGGTSDVSISEGPVTLERDDPTFYVKKNTT